MKLRVLALTGALAIAGAACGGGDDDKGSKGNDTPAVGTVNATDSLKFDPASVSVKTGETVTWRNAGKAPHNVTFKDGSFTKDLKETDTVTYTASKAGSYKYECTIHPGMVGTVVVS